MTFTPQFLDELRNRVPVSDIVGRRVKLQRRGREHSGLCPFHNEKTPSFTVNDDKAFYHCFGCGAHGDVIGFVMQTEGLTFPEAVEKLAGLAGLSVPRATPEERQRAQRAKSLHDANEAAAKWFESQLRRPQGRDALAYLRERGLTDETIARFRLGYAPDARDALKSALMADGYEEDQLLEAGLIAKPEDGRASYDRFRGRVIFPIGDRRGRVIAFGGRAMGDGQPKYLNSPETPLFNKGRTLYALALVREKVRQGGADDLRNQVIVTEGYMDVIALHQAGFGGAVAPLGTALSEAQIEEIWRIAPEPILCFDGDQAGRRAAARVVERALPILRPGHSVRFAMLPEGEDPDSLIQASGGEAMIGVVERAHPMIDQLWEIETSGRPDDTPERRSAIRKALRDQAARIADKSVQAAYFDELDARFAARFRRRSDASPSKSGDRDRGGWSRDRRARPGEPGFDIGVRADGQVDILALRAQQALIAAPINHPELLDDVAERLGSLDVAAGSELDRLRSALVALGGVAPPETDALANALREAGQDDALRRVLAPAVYQLHPFAAPSTDLAASRAGWEALYRVFAQRNWGDEVDAARRRFAADPSERNLAYLEAVKRQRGSRDSDDEAPHAALDTRQAG